MLKNYFSKRLQQARKHLRSEPKSSDTICRNQHDSISSISLNCPIPIQHTWSRRSELLEFIMDCGKRTFHRRRVIVRSRSSATVDDGPNGSTSRLLRIVVDCTPHSNRMHRDDHRITRRRTRSMNQREILKFL